jgi:hypothetical protein
MSEPELCLQDFLKLPLIVANGLGAAIEAKGCTELADLALLDAKDFETICGTDKTVVQKKLQLLIQQHVPGKVWGSGPFVKMEHQLPATDTFQEPVVHQTFQNINATGYSTLQVTQELAVDDAFQTFGRKHGGSRQKSRKLPAGFNVIRKRRDPSVPYNFTDAQGAAAGGWLPPSAYTVLINHPNGMQDHAYQLFMRHTGQWIAGPAQCDADGINFEIVAREIIYRMKVDCHMDGANLMHAGFKPRDNLRRSVAGIRSNPPRAASKLWCVDIPLEERCEPHFPQVFVDAVAHAESNKNDGVRKATQRFLVDQGLMKPEDIPDGVNKLLNVEIAEGMVQPVAAIVVTAHTNSPGKRVRPAPPSTATGHGRKRKGARTNKQAKEDEEEPAQEDEEEQDEQEAAAADDRLKYSLFDESDDDGAAEKQRRSADKLKRNRNGHSSKSKMQSPSRSKMQRWRSRRRSSSSYSNRTFINGV